jgi:hypothetical protein|tara:strand:+ start:974 stop:1102 length:129 start_codon:yes stop_codon:yes gene_type:complete
MVTATAPWNGETGVFVLFQFYLQNRLACFSDALQWRARSVVP